MLHGLVHFYRHVDFDDWLFAEKGNQFTVHIVEDMGSI